MVLSGIEIERLTSSNSLIAPFIKKNLRNSSYDLTVGDEIYCGSQHKSKLVTTYLGLDETFEIPAYGLAYILCSENIKLPNNITARISLRMSLIYKGLILTVQPPFDPNYDGKAIIFLHNMSTSPVFLKRGERIATLEFFWISNPKVEDIFDQVTVRSLQQNIKHDVQSGLSDLIKKDEKNNNKENFLILNFVAALGIFLALFTFITDKMVNSAKDEMNIQYKNKINELESQIKSIKNEKKLVNSNNEGGE